jgi:hypothetical protein
MDEKKENKTKQSSGTRYDLSPSHPKACDSMGYTVF